MLPIFANFALENGDKLGNQNVGVHVLFKADFEINGDFCKS